MSDQSTSPTAAAPDQPEQSRQAPPERSPDVGAQQLEQLRAERDDYEDRWRRAMAEVDNTRKRYERDLRRRVEDERSRVAAAWLPVLDSLDMALQHAQADPNSIIGGVQAVRDQALAVLAQLGFPRRPDEQGHRFDPSRHEAVSTVRTDQAPPGHILQVVRPGYGSEQVMLRPASVIVAAEVDDGQRT